MSSDAVIDAAATELARQDPPIAVDDRVDGQWGTGTRIHPSGSTTPAADDTGEDVDELDGWEEVDLQAVLEGSHTQPVPDILTRSDGRSLWYTGMVNGLHGDSGTGKGWIVCFTISQAIRDGLKVLIIDLEDTADSLISRLTLLGLQPEQIAAAVSYRRPQSGFTDAVVDYLRGEIATQGYALTVIDSLGEAFALDSINEDRDNEVGPWLRRVTRPLADAGTAVVLIDHSTKATEKQLHPSGSKRKRANVGGASYLIEATRPLKKGAGGRLKITCAKDRHGNYARGEHVADFVVLDDGTSPPRFELYAPDQPSVTSTNGGIEVTLLAAKFVRLVKDTTTPLNKTMAREMIQATARNDTKRAALDFAISTGALAIEPGRRGAKNLVYVHDLETPN